MIHPFFTKLVTQPGLFAEHIAAYADLASAEVRRFGAVWQRRVVLAAACAVATVLAMTNDFFILHLYRQAETILATEAPVLPLTYHRWSALVKPVVTHFPISPMRRWFLKDVVVAQGG